MYTAKVEVALGRNISNVGGNLLLPAELPYSGRGGGIVDGDEDHFGALEIGRFEVAIDMRHLLLADPEADFIVEARRRRDYGDGSIGVKAVKNSSGSNLEEESKFHVSEGCIEGVRALHLGSRFVTYLTTSDNQDFLPFDLPCQDKASAGLDFWELLGHRCDLIDKVY